MNPCSSVYPIGVFEIVLDELTSGLKNNNFRPHQKLEGIRSVMRI